MPIYWIGRKTVLCLGLIAASLAATPAHAQSSGSGGTKGTGHSLNLHGSLFASYTNDALADLSRAGGGAGAGLGAPVAGLRSEGEQSTGVFSGMNGSLAYGYNTHKANTTFILNARTNASYYPDLKISAVQHMGDIAVSRPLGGRTNVQFSQDARASDHYRLELLPDITSDDPAAVLRLGDEYALVSRKTYSYSSVASLSHNLTKRAALGVNYGLKFVDSPDAAFDFMNHTVGASFKYQLTRYGSLRAGYGYRESPRATGPDDGQLPFRSHNVNLGIDYNRAFSLSGRRTSLTFGTGSAIIATGAEEQQGGQTTTNSNLRPTFLGSVTLRRNLARSWDAQAGYRRAVHFIEGFSHPIFTEGIAASVGGQMAERVLFSAMAAYSVGAVGASRTANHAHGSQTASTQLLVLLTKRLSLSTQYFYFRQRLGEDVVLPEGIPRKLNRQSLRLGLTFQLPLIS